MRLLIWGHWSHTGFGVVTQSLGERFVQAGVDVRVLAMNHRGEPIKGPLAGRVYPLQFLEQHFNAMHKVAVDGRLWRMLDPEDDWKPDGVLVIADVSGLRGYIRDDINAWQDVPVWHYCPIEGDDLPPLWRAIWQHIAPVTMSEYGRRVVSEHIGRDVPMVYHGVDTEQFYPASPGRPIRFDGGTLRSKADCKAKFGIPEGTKVLLRADRNVVRKNYDALFRAFVPIAEADPAVWLVLHCQPIDREGIDLYQELAKMPEAIRPRVKFTTAHDTFRGLPVEGLNALYNAADVYVTTTGGEGFGLTIAESLAAGVPVVSNGWAAEVEVIGDGGIIVPPLHDSYGDPIRYHDSGYGMAWAMPDPRAFTEPVLSLLSKPSRARSLGQMGRIHVKRSFSWDEAAGSFIELFTEPFTPAELAA